jgi:Cu/Ag efflux protein CusF
MRRIHIIAEIISLKEIFMNKMTSFILIFLIATNFILCSKQEEQVEVSEGGTFYKSAGRIVSIVTEDNVVFVKHDDIPGFMAAMTMGLRVKDSKLLESVQLGDSIHFTITVAEGEMFISRMIKIE